MRHGCLCSVLSSELVIYMIAHALWRCTLIREYSIAGVVC